MRASYKRIQQDNNISKSWAFKGETSARNFKRMLSGIQILLDLDSDGNLLFEFLWDPTMKRL
jgi:hypothetical protein